MLHDPRRLANITPQTRALSDKSSQHCQRTILHWQTAPHEERIRKAKRNEYLVKSNQIRQDNCLHIQEFIHIGTGMR